MALPDQPDLAQVFSIVETLCDDLERSHIQYRLWAVIFNRIREALGIQRIRIHDRQPSPALLQIVAFIHGSGYVKLSRDDILRRFAEIASDGAAFEELSKIHEGKGVLIHLKDKSDG